MRRAAIFYLAIVLYVFWPILLPPEGMLVFGDDIHRSYHFFRQLFGDAIAKGEFPWWNPYLFSGEPLIANPSLAFWYPVNWLFAVLPYRFVYSWTIPLHIFWAMLGMFVLLRGLSSRRTPGSSLISNFKFQISNWENRKRYAHVEYSRHRDLGAWIGGLVFGLSGFFMGRVWEGHIELIAAASWMPWVFGAFWKLIQTHPTKLCSSIILSAVVLAMQILAGYQTMALFTLEAVFIVTLFYQCYLIGMSFPFSFSSSPRRRGSSIFQIRDSGSRAGMTVGHFRPLIRVITVVLLGLGLAGIQIIPGQEFFRNSIRTYPLPYTWAVFGSYTTQNLKQLIDPFILGLPWAYKGPSPNYGEMAAYVGKGGLVLAILGFIALPIAWMRGNKRSKNDPRPGIENTTLMAIFGVVALFGLWLSFGWNAPVDLNKILWELVPTYKYLRIPSRHLILFVFGMSALAALGFDQIMRILSFARPGLAKLTVVTISLVIVVDMLWFARTFVVLGPDPATRHSAELIQLLLPHRCRGYSTPEVEDDCLYRFLPNFNVGMGTRDALDFDAAMGYRLFSASGYDPAILRNYYEFAAAAGGIAEPDVQTSDVQIPYLLPASRYLDFLNVKYIFVPSWFDSVAGSSSKYKLVMEENTKDYFRLYENTRVLPRFYLVPTIVGLADRESIARAIRAGEYDPGNAVLVRNNNLPSGFTADCAVKQLPPVALVSYSMNHIILTTDAFCDAILVTSEVFYPGWKASIDGKPATLIEGNLAFRTLPVPAGKHTIVMSYLPTSIIIGFFVSAVTAIGCWVWAKKRVS